MMMMMMLLKMVIISDVDANFNGQLLLSVSA